MNERLSDEQLAEYREDVLRRNAGYQSTELSVVDELRDLRAKVTKAREAIADHHEILQRAGACEEAVMAVGFALTFFDDELGDMGNEQ